MHFVGQISQFVGFLLNSCKLISCFVKSKIGFMKYRVKIHSDFYRFNNWIKALPETFDHQGKMLVDGRNQVKLIEVDGVKFVVKYFRKITLANRFIYRYLRASKGERAYENAMTLLDRRISTPTPVAFIDVYGRGILEGSYFVSLYVEFDSAFDLLNRPFTECEDHLKLLARFLYNIHRKGVFHADLNLTNVLHCPSNSESPFCLIDNNRIRFRKYNSRSAMRNLRRIHMPVVNYAALIGEYARLSRQDAFRTVGQLMGYHRLNSLFRKTKRFLKNLILMPFRIINTQAVR